MRNVTIAESGYGRPEAQNSDMNEIAQNVQQEVSVTNANHIGLDNLDILESREVSFLESSEPNDLGDEFVSPNTMFVEQKKIRGDEYYEMISAETSLPVSGFSGPEEVGELVKDVALHSGGKFPLLQDTASKTSMEDAGLLHNQARASTIDNQGAASSFETPNAKSIEQKEIRGDKNNEMISAKTSTPVSVCSGLEKVGEPGKDVALHSDGKLPILEDSASKTSMENACLLHDQATSSTIDNQGAAPRFDAIENFGLQQSEPALTEVVNIAAEVGLDRANLVRSKKRKTILVPLETTKVLRSRSQEKAKAPESKAMGFGDRGNEARNTKRGRKKGIKNHPINEFSRIRTHLRYLLHRINYEKNLIDAYSCEGWKGQSLEKIKPEKELQRARSQIFRFKLKIRDLFQRLDASFLQGKLPESLFDSEGKIDSEDIFCAKCGSKDLTLDNDIILCDGACERGFHQFCLEPPLLKEDIPPGDESWLCPGCDCKDKCCDMLKDLQGSRLSIFDNWEKVFPEEAAAAASGKDMYDICSLQSEDSEDDDYNPDNEELGHKAPGDDSDKSSYFSASDVMVTSQNDREVLGLPSDDSEDDDFDPSVPNDDQPTEHESSGSDFTSNSEESGAIVDEENCPDKDEGYAFSLPDYSKLDASAGEEKSTMGEVKVQSLGDELSYLQDSDAAPVSGKRRVERLDYKKLHDETYGRATSDSSDEDYGEKAGKKRRKCQPDAKDGNDCRRGNEHTPNMEGRRSFDAPGPSNANVTPEKNSGVCSSGKNASKPNRRLGKAAIQRLVECFKENQYPEKDVIESLAKELGLTVQQVSKWFVNSRWSFRHTSRMESKLARISGTDGIPPPQLKEITPNLEHATASSNSYHGVEEMRPLQASPL